MKTDCWFEYEYEYHYRLSLMDTHIHITIEQKHFEVINVIVLAHRLIN